MKNFYSRIIKVEIFGKDAMDGKDDDVYAIVSNETDPEAKFIMNGEDAMEILTTILEQLEKEDKEES